MAGLFGLHLEDAEGEGGRVVDMAPGALDESETATAEIADLQQEDAERVAADAEADDLEERVDIAEELHDEVEPVVTEGVGYDRAGMALLMVGMRRVAGRQGKHLVGKNLKMEAIDAGVSGRKEQTRIQFEDLKATLKQAWAAIKQAFKKAWAKVKTWYIKTFDASKKLKARATKIRDRAEGMSATIDKKSFTFSGIKTLGKNGKIGEAGDVKSGMETLKGLADAILDVQSSNSLDSKVDDFVTAIGAFGKADTGNLSKVQSVVTAIETAIGLKEVAGNKPSEVEGKIETGLGGDENTYKYSAVLPGDKVIIFVKGKRGSNNDVDNELACVRRTRLTFSNVKDKPKEVASGAEAKTANSSQIASICQSVISIAENIFDFKKGWEARDNHQNKIIKEIDDQFRDIEKDLNDDDTNGEGSKKARVARSIASAATGLIRRDSSFKASFVGYLMNTSNVALSYCERSIASHK